MVARLAFTAALAAAALSLPARDAAAADLYRHGHPPRAESPYDDPRYADLYGDPPPRPYKDVAPYNGWDVYREPPRGPYRDRYGYLEPMPAPPPPPHYGRPPLPPRYSDGACLPRHVIRRDLIREGWTDFEDLEIYGDYAKVTARRSDGRLYRLTVDKCNGDIVRAQLIDGYPDAYASRHRATPYRPY